MIVSLLHRLSLCFAAGALGGLANGAAVLLLGGFGVTAALGVAVDPVFTPSWLYPRIVWGGLWGLLFLLPVNRSRWVTTGLVLGLAPALVQLLVVFPEKTPHGLFGLGLGTLTPFFVVVFNAIWGLVTAWTLKRTMP